MAQIAQQDNLIIEITGALAAMNETTKQKLIDCIKVGTITGKVLGYMVDTTAAESPKYSVAIMDVNSGTLKTVELN